MDKKKRPMKKLKFAEKKDEKPISKMKHSKEDLSASLKHMREHAK